MIAMSEFRSSVVGIGLVRPSAARRGWLAALACLLAACTAATAGTVYVNGTMGNDAWSGLCQTWDGATCGPKQTIQAGIDIAVAGDTVLVADGIYSGTGNKDLDFNGKAITVQSASADPATCIIDCQGSGRGFYFHIGETAVCVVSGFTIRNGRAVSVSPGGANGGGVCCDSSSPTLANCVISGNNAEAGGGVYCNSCSPTLADCTISGNGGVLVGSCYGGGVYCSGSNPTLTNCTISGNHGDGRGGGLYCDSSSPTLTDCTISDNWVSVAFNHYDEACGGGVCCLSSSPTLTRCTISGNAVASGGFWMRGGGGVYCGESSAPLLLNCAINGNTASAGGAGVSCASSYLIATNCEFRGNNGSEALGVRDCRDSGVLTNCTIIGNNDGGVVCACDLTLVNCTISGNVASVTGGAVYCNSSSVAAPTLTNCILWGDTPREIYVSSGSPFVTYCDVQGGYTGGHNINADPLFVDAAGGDYRLSALSPCIDAGGNAAVPAGVVTDFGGNPRFVDDPYKADTGSGTPPIVDMGAYEVPFLRGDANCDGGVDLDDISPFVLALVDQTRYEVRYPGCPWLNSPPQNLISAVFTRPRDDRDRRLATSV